MSKGQLPSFTQSKRDTRASIEAKWLVLAAIGIGLAGAIFTTILAGGGADNLPETTVRAVDAGFLFSSGVAVLAALVCLARGDDRPNVRPESKIS